MCMHTIALIKIEIDKLQENFVSFGLNTAWYKKYAEDLYKIEVGKQYKHDSMYLWRDHVYC